MPTRRRSTKPIAETDAGSTASELPDASAEPEPAGAAGVAGPVLSKAASRRAAAAGARSSAPGVPAVEPAAEADAVLSPGAMLPSEPAAGADVALSPEPALAAEPALPSQPAPLIEPSPIVESGPTVESGAAVAPIAAPAPAIPVQPAAQAVLPLVVPAVPPAGAIPSVEAPTGSIGVPGLAPMSPPPPPPPTMQPGPAVVPVGTGGPTAGEQASELARETFETLSTTTRTFVRTLDPTGIRPTLIVAGIIVALVLGTQLLNGVIPTPGARFGPGPGVSGPTTPGSPIDVTGNVRFRLASGWQPTQRYSDNLPGVLLQKGNAYLEARATRGAYGGSLNQFLAEISGIVGGQLSGYQSTQPSPTSLGGLGGLRVAYAGTNRNGNPQEGEITVAMAPDGSMFLAHAFGVRGSVESVIAEIRDMLATLEVH